MVSFCRMSDSPQEALANTGKPSGAYLLGVGDEVSIWVDQLESLSGKSFIVDRDGCITLPLAGSVYVEGATVERAEDLIRESLKKYVRDPVVGINIVQAKNEVIAISGSVTHPGLYQLPQAKTLVDLLVVAGGILPNAGPSAIIMRPLTSGRLDLPDARDDSTGRFSTAEVNVRAVMSLRDSAQNIMLLAGDAVSVPEARTVYVIGDVNKPGAFPVNDEQQTTALQVLAMAGGTLKTAAPDKAKILRNSRTGEKPTMISINLKQLMKGNVPDMQLQPNDILFVPNSVQKAATARALDAAIQTGLLAITYGAIYK
jgi:polysaccharide export outer membrane protein